MGFGEALWVDHAILLFALNSEGPLEHPAEIFAPEKLRRR
jgi:hypothetical protein